MKIKELHSITEIKPEDCYQTKGSRPVRVLCDDFNYYVCKYHNGKGFPFPLFNEYIAACFLKIWNLPVPEIAFVKIKKDHIRLIDYPYHYFDNLCLGSKYFGEFKEVDKLFLETPLIKKENLTGRDSFLRIGLFDIWMCNEDRHYENFNLLYNLKSNQFVPIDHVYCFNTLNLDKEPYLISENESILTTPFLSRFFSRPLQLNLNETRLKLIEDFKLNVTHCHEELNDILANIPLAWEPDRGFLKSRLDIFFSEPWLQSCIDYFTTLITLNIKTQ